MTTADDRTRALDGLRLAGRHAAVSHQSAARLLGIEQIEDAGGHQLTVPRNRSRLVVPGWTVVRADVAENEMIREDDLRVTSALRTVIDLARTRPTVEALVAAESAVRLGLVDADAVRRRLISTQGHGARGVRLVGKHVDARSESVLETRLRWVLFDAGLPAPMTQHRVLDHDGDEVGRVDFAWPTHGLVVEADGYAFHSDRASYRRDRERGNELVRLGWRVLRFTWEDVTLQPHKVSGVVRACLQSAPYSSRNTRSA